MAGVAALVVGGAMVVAGTVKAIQGGNAKKRARKKQEDCGRSISVCTKRFKSR